MYSKLVFIFRDTSNCSLLQFGLPPGTQEQVSIDLILNNPIQTVMSGKPDSAAYDFMNSRRLITGFPVFEGGKPAFSIFVIASTSTIFSQIGNIIFTERIEIQSLLDPQATGNKAKWTARCVLK